MPTSVNQSNHTWTCPQSLLLMVSFTKLCPNKTLAQVIEGLPIEYLT